MTAPWSMDVRVAGHDWTVTDLDPATPGPTAPLTMRHALPDELWPAQPLPMTATFGLVAATAAELADVTEGAGVHLGFTAPPNPDPVWFDGNVSDVEIDPVRFQPDPDVDDVVDGVRVTITAIGYLAQLWEESITIDETDPGGPDRDESTDQSTDVLNRLQNIFDASVWNSPQAGPDMTSAGGLDPSFIWNDFPLTSMAALNVTGEALGPHLDAVFRYWLWSVGTDDDGNPLLEDVSRIVVEPLVDPVTRELSAVNAWQARLVSNKVVTPVAANLEETPTGWGVVVDPDAGGNVIAANRIEKDIRFVQRKRANVNQVVVPYVDTGGDGKPHTLSVNNGTSPSVTQTLPGEGGDLPAVTDWYDPDQTPDSVIRPIAEFYLPAGHADAWGVDTVVWRLDRDTPGRTPPPLGALVVVAGVPETQNPNGKAWISGLVKSWTLTLPDGAVELDLATSRGRAAPDPAGDRLTWDELPAGVTWDQLRPEHTWEDADMLRGP